MTKSENKVENKGDISLDSESVLSSYMTYDDLTASVVLSQPKRSIPFSFLRHNSRCLVVVGEFLGTHLLMTWETLVIKIHCEFKQVMDCQDKKLRRKANRTMA